MRVSTQFPIAVHAVMMMAFFPQIRVTSDVVAQSAGCNSVIVRTLFSKLKKAGIVCGTAGTGGTRLARSPEDITLWDVYTAVESDQTDELFKFHAHPSGACPVGGSLRMLLMPHLNNAVMGMKERLSAIALSQLTSELRAIHDS